MDRVITGSGAYPGSKIFVTLPNGFVVAAYVSITTFWYIDVPVILMRGQTVTVTQLELGKQIESDPVRMTVSMQSNEISQPPVVTQPVRASEGRIYGTGVPDSLVTAKYPQGNLFGTWVESDGNWHVLIRSAGAGDRVEIWQMEEGKNQSESVFITIQP